jgi:heme/copper-type cytochrome/quinol oxidase subunit 4
MAQKTKFKSYTLLFSIVVFILTAVGLAFLYYKMLDPPFWFTFVYIAAYPLLIVFAYDLFIAGSKLSRKKLLLLFLGVLIISAIATHSVWVIVTPRWSFSVSTDKNTYRLGEEVKITASLKNLGFITFFFKSRVSEPVLVLIWYQYTENPTPTYSVCMHTCMQTHI